MVWRCPEASASGGYSRGSAGVQCSQHVCSLPAGRPLTATLGTMLRVLRPGDSAVRAPLAPLDQGRGMHVHLLGGCC